MEEGSRMREILFKAKRTDNGEWVEGALLDGENHCLIGQSIKFSPNDKYECKIVGFEVNRETICQYTGLTDKNGEKIWEGDIVDILCEVEEIGVIEWDAKTARFSVRADGFTADFNNYRGNDLEVIDNIFDNPELL